jgi:hypothetical protein
MPFVKANKCALQNRFTLFIASRKYQQGCKLCPAGHGKMGTKSLCYSFKAERVVQLQLLRMRAGRGVLGILVELVHHGDFFHVMV